MENPHSIILVNLTEMTEMTEEGGSKSCFFRKCGRIEGKEYNFAYKVIK